jgi:uncharacterized membrane protein
MNPFQTTYSSGTGWAVLLSVITGLITVATGILWLWIGWRAMRAHERIADSLAQPERTLP